jgi:hypothetical protein
LPSLPSSVFTFPCIGRFQKSLQMISNCTSERKQKLQVCQWIFNKVFLSLPFGKTGKALCSVSLRFYLEETLSSFSLESHFYLLIICTYLYCALPLTVLCYLYHTKHWQPAFLGKEPHLVMFRSKGSHQSFQDHGSFTQPALECGRGNPWASGLLSERAQHPSPTFFLLQYSAYFLHSICLPIQTFLPLFISYNLALLGRCLLQCWALGSQHNG